MIKIVKISFHVDANDNANVDRENITHMFNDCSNKSILTMKRANEIRKSIDEIEQKNSKFSKKKYFRKKRRKRRHMIKNHH